MVDVGSKSEQFKAGRARAERSRGQQPRLHDWRADTGHLRWLILGTLGLLGGACGADVAQSPADTRGPELVATDTCVEPRTDLGGGFERCGDGVVHRSAVRECPSALPRALTEHASDPNDQCEQDSDCTEAPHGYCVLIQEAHVYACSYGCVADWECGGGQVCRCGAPVGHCEEATCSSDAQCGEGLLCSEYEREPGCEQKGFGCQSAADSCESDDDCVDTETGEREWCALRNDGRARECRPVRCAIGRPFLIDGEARLAPAVIRRDWYPASATAPAPRALGTRERAAVRDGWLQQALMEHASVAAFARFGLLLSGLGAPPELLEGAASAMLDELKHARGCFELARRHSDIDVGPGPLPLGGALRGTDLESVVLDTILEGCIGETVAAMEAAELREHTQDEAARALLEQIARDEAEHARLAWRFVAWAISTGPEGLGERVAAVFAAEVDAAASEVPAPCADPSLEQALLASGLASESLRQALRRRVLVEVVGPCAKTLLTHDAAPVSHASPA